MCDDTTEQGCLEDSVSSAALIFINDKTAYLEDNGYPEITVQYFYNMVRGLEHWEMDLNEKKRLVFSPKFTNYFDAFITKNNLPQNTKTSQPNGPKAISVLYIYHLNQESLAINAVDKNGIEEKYKGSLVAFLNLYGPASGMEYDWLFSDLIEMDAPHNGRDYISAEGLKDFASLYEVAVSISAEDESWDKEVLSTFNQLLKILNRSLLSKVNKGT